jgi:hypothetical protein
MRDVGQPNGRSFAIGPDRNLAKIIDVLDVAEPADHVFGLAHLDQPAAHVVVGALDCRADMRQRNSVGSQRVGVDLDLILLDVAANRRNLRDSRHRL